MSEGILAGLRVVDFTHIFAGPYATQILADLGADVVKIERVDGGDAARYYGLDENEGELSGPFVALNRNKKSISVDLSTKPGLEVVRRLITESDVVVENFRAGVMKRWGLDYQSLSEERPGIVYASISGFGRGGPLSDKPANDLVMQAFSGLMSITGEAGRPPVRVGTAVSDFTAGLYAVIGILAALVRRGMSGHGQEIETSMVEGQLSLMCYFFSEFWNRDVVPQPMGTANRLGLPNQAFPTSDGWVAITSANEPMWVRCCEAMGVADLAGDERFSSLGRRYKNRDELVKILSDVTQRMTTAELVDRLEEQRVSCAPIQDVPTVATGDFIRDIDAVLEVPTGDGGTARVIGSPLHFSSANNTQTGRVPLVGQDTVEILESLEYSGGEIQALIESGVVAVRS